MKKQNWSREELEASVRSYLEMRQKELDGKKYKKMSEIAKTVKTQKLWKLVKTNEVVWDAIGTAANWEKMFWTAGTEIYR